MNSQNNTWSEFYRVLHNEAEQLRQMLKQSGPDSEQQSKAERIVEVYRNLKAGKKSLF